MILVDTSVIPRDAYVAHVPLLTAAELPANDLPTCQRRCQFIAISSNKLLDIGMFGPAARGRL